MGNIAMSKELLDLYTKKKPRYFAKRTSKYAIATNILRNII